MANFLAALLAVAALLQVGTAAPYYPATNATVEARHYNSTFPHVIVQRSIRTYPIALRRP